MLGVNKVILIGNLGRDPEFKYTPSGKAVATFTLATSERFTDSNGQRQDRTEWHNIVVWGRQAELANQYLKKGRSAYIEGKITTRSWDDRDGNKKYKTEIVASSIQFIGGSGGGGSGGSAQAGGGSTPSQDDFAADSAPAEPAPGGVAEDDLPF